MDQDRLQSFLQSDRKRIYAFLLIALIEMGIGYGLTHLQSISFWDGCSISLLLIAGFHFFLGAIALNNHTRAKSASDPYQFLVKQAETMGKHTIIETLAFSFGLIFMVTGVLLKNSLLNVGIGAGICTTMAISLIWWLIRKWHLELFLEEI